MSDTLRQLPPEDVKAMDRMAYESPAPVEHPQKVEPGSTGQRVADAIAKVDDRKPREENGTSSVPEVALENSDREKVLKAIRASTDLKKTKQTQSNPFLQCDEKKAA